MGRPDWIKVHGTDATADARYKRTAAGLSQRELAALIGPRQLVIARLSNGAATADSVGAGQRLEIRFVPEERGRG